MSRKPIARPTRVLEIAIQKSALEKESQNKPSTAPTVITPSCGGIQKPKKVISKKNLSQVRKLPCFICGEKNTDVDHIKTRGSGGGDELENLQSLCRRHHSERHSLGIKSFILRYHTILNEIREKFDLPPMNLGILDD